jgi:WXG100 family type VII secretion target
MSGYTVSFADVRSAAATMTAAGHSLREELGALSARVEQLLAGGWRGAAATAFAREWEAWRTGAGGVIGALTALAHTLNGGGTAYAETDAEVRAAAAS